MLTPKNIEKYRFARTHAGPGALKIESGAIQNTKKAITMSQKRAKSVQEAAKSEKKTPKSEKCANMAPTRPRFTLEFGPFWLPLRKEKQYVNASIKCSRV